MPSTEYMMIQDCDCHWYIIPADRRAEATAHFKAAEEFWSGADPKGKSLEKDPDWMVAVGGSPSRVKFTGYSIHN